jgi:serine/threonine-protein kinase
VAKRIALLRDALGDDSADPHYIKSVRAYGYGLAALPVREESTVAGTAQAKSQRVTRWTGVSLAAVIALAGIIISVIYLQPEDQAPIPKSIAVLPFRALGDDPGNQEFADGLTEEIMHSLARTGSLRVAGRASSFRYSDSDDGPIAIGNALNVAHLLEGSVRQIGDQVRIGVQLVDTREGIQRWSESWERPVGDVLDIQREISERVSEQLQVALSGDDRSKLPVTDNAEAYALYLRASSLMEYPFGSDLPRAQALLEQAVGLDQNFAAAWALLGAAHMRRTLWNEPTYELSANESLAVARDAIDRALAADPNEGLTFVVLAGLTWAFEDDIAKTVRLAEQAVQHRPWDLSILIFSADIARSLGRLTQSRQLATYVLERDPLCGWCRVSLLTTLLALEDYESLEREARLAMQVTPLTPDNRHLMFSLGMALLLGGNPAEAAAVFRQIDEESDLRLAGLAMASHTLGEELESARYQEPLLTRSLGHASINSQVAAWKGEHERALEFLDQWVERRDLRVSLQTQYLNPVYKGLHDLPGWQRFLGSIGRSPEQIDGIEFNVTRYLDAMNNSVQ